MDERNPTHNALNVLMQNQTQHIRKMQRETRRTPASIIIEKLDQERTHLFVPPGVLNAHAPHHH